MKITPLYGEEKITLQNVMKERNMLPCYRPQSYFLGLGKHGQQFLMDIRFQGLSYSVFLT